MTHSTANAEDVYLSVVVPAYNEEESLPPLVAEITEAMKRVDRPWEIVLVNDGSTDGTWSVMNALKAATPQVRPVRLAQNGGLSTALVAGVRAARGEVVAMLDADLQNDPADIPMLLAKMKEGPYDAVCGVRAKRRDNFIRRLSSKIGNGFRNTVTGDKVTDTGCSLKTYRRACFLEVPPFRGMHRFLPTLFRMQGRAVCEVAVNHRERQFGEAKFGVWNRVFRGLRDCFGVRWLRSRAVTYEVAEEG